jgi:hypothetical protein
MSLKGIRQEITDELSECSLDPITYRDHGGESVGDLVRVRLFSPGEHLIDSSSNTFSILHGRRYSDCRRSWSNSSAKGSRRLSSRIC